MDPVVSHERAKEIVVKHWAVIVDIAELLGQHGSIGQELVTEVAVAHGVDFGSEIRPPT